MSPLLLCLSLVVGGARAAADADTGGAWAPPAPAGTAPVALAGVPFLAYPGETIVLDGSGSYDPDGDALEFLWEQVDGPLVELLRADTDQPTFEAVEAGVVSIGLTVTDPGGLSGSDVVDVVVVDPGAGQRMGEGGCAVAPGRFGPGALLLALGLLLLRRR